MQRQLHPEGEGPEGALGTAQSRRGGRVAVRRALGQQFGVLQPSATAGWMTAETATAPPTTANAMTTASMSFFMASSAAAALGLGDRRGGRDVGGGASSTEEGEHGQGGDELLPHDRFPSFFGCSVPKAIP